MIRNIQKQFTTIEDLGYDNLVVSGCSFTYNNSDSSATTWPYYLRDLGNFKEVYDCSLPGAGNNHIKNSIIGLLDDNPKLVNSKTLVMICWSGCDRDDLIVPESQLGTYPFKHKYCDNNYAGISGGTEGHPNLMYRTVTDEIKKVKNRKSRSFENYVYIRSLYAYLKDINIDFVFFNYRDPNIPARDHHWDITNNLTSNYKNMYNKMIHNWSMDLYSFALRNQMMEDDEYHPSPNGHLEFTKQILLPELKTLLRKS